MYSCTPSYKSDFSSFEVLLGLGSPSVVFAKNSLSETAHRTGNKRHEKGENYALPNMDSSPNIGRVLK